MGLDQRIQDKDGNALWEGRSWKRLHEVIRLLSKRGDFANGVCSVTITPEAARFIAEFQRYEPEDMPSDLECVLAFGDDVRYIASW